MKSDYFWRRKQDINIENNITMLARKNWGCPFWWRKPHFMGAHNSWKQLLSAYGGPRKARAGRSGNESRCKCGGRAPQRESLVDHWLHWAAQRRRQWRPASVGAPFLSPRRQSWREAPRYDSSWPNFAYCLRWQCDHGARLVITEYQFTFTQTCATATGVSWHEKPTAQGSRFKIVYHFHFRLSLSLYPDLK